MTDMSLAPIRDMYNVRGMGVADNVRQSTPVLIFFKCSFARTPNRCSSSMMINPKSLNLTSSLMIRCVPITMSTEPRAAPSKVSLICLGVRKRERTPIVTGKFAIRSTKLSKCCIAKTVVGTRTATCFRPSTTALKAARIATSVLPYPTSPQIRRSITLGELMSSLRLAIAAS